MGVSEEIDSQSREGVRAAGSCIWFLSVMMLRGDRRSLARCAQALSHPHKEVHYTTWQRRGLRFLA